MVLVVSPSLQLCAATLCIIWYQINNFTLNHTCRVLTLPVASRQLALSRPLLLKVQAILSQFYMEIGQYMNILSEISVSDLAACP